MDDAEAAKAEGNAHFAAQRYAEAISSYSRAISLDDTKRAFYSNRSGAYLAINDPSAALEDAKHVRCLGRPSVLLRASPAAALGVSLYSPACRTANVR